MKNRQTIKEKCETYAARPEAKCTTAGLDHVAWSRERYNIEMWAIKCFGVPSEEYLKNRNEA